jgi:hypothetical protein
LALLFWLGSCFFPIGGDVLVKVSKKMGEQMKELVVSVKRLARSALFANRTNLRTDVSLVRGRVELTLKNMIEWFWGIRTDAEERGRKRGSPIVHASLDKLAHGSAGVAMFINSFPTKTPTFLADGIALFVM